jgi:catalase
MSKLGEQLVAAITELNGSHPGHRAVHANGICATGSFLATAEAARLSRACYLSGEPVDVTVRFSNGSGVPGRPDTAADGRGFAVKLRPAVGGATDLVALSLPVFFVRTADDFIAFTRARVPDPSTGEADPARVGAFIGEHPEALAAVQASLEAQAPASYATIPYFGIHAFRYVDAAGVGRFGRYAWTPAAGRDTLDADTVAGRPVDYLRTELATRLDRGPVRFGLEIQLADDSDDLSDPTVAWPDDRERIHAGTLTLDTFTADACDAMIFDPTNVTDGVECSGDPILHARSEAYAVSYARRTPA